MSKRFTFGSLFSGIGGIDLGLERAGMRCEWQCEKDEYCTKVLQKHWPDVTRYADIRTVDSNTLVPVDLIAGGFPCQPHSLAGSRKASADGRDLWGEFARVIRELKPRWALAENVLGLLSSEDGRFFGGVLRDLAACGYDAQWFVLSAAQFGAPHLRERVFIVAHTASPRPQEWAGATGISAEPSSPNTRTLSYSNSLYEWIQQEQESRGKSASIARDDGTQELMAHPRGAGWEECQSSTFTSEQGHNPWVTRDPGMQGQFEPRVCGDTSGVSAWLDRYHWPAGPGQPQHEWEPPRVVTARVVDRAKRLKALGNAVVPQIAEYIGRMIMESEAHEGVG